MQAVYVTASERCLQRCGIPLGRCVEEHRLRGSGNSESVPRCVIRMCLVCDPKRYDATRSITAPPHAFQAMHDYPTRFPVEQSKVDSFLYAQDSRELHANVLSDPLPNLALDAHYHFAQRSRCATITRREKGTHHAGTSPSILARAETDSDSLEYFLTVRRGERPSSCFPAAPAVAPPRSTSSTVQKRRAGRPARARAV